MNLGALAKKVVRAGLYHGRVLDAIRYWNREGLRILMYHDFPAVEGLAESLDEQCRHMRRHYSVISLDEAAHGLMKKQALPKNALAVTADDGNRDFFVKAYPIFRAHGIPVTVFLVSAFLDRQLWFWWDKLGFLVDAAQQASLTIPLIPGQSPSTFDISTPARRERVLTTIAYSIKRLPVATQETMLSELSQTLGVTLPVNPPEHLGPITWSEARDMAAHGITIGAHTVTHARMADLHRPKTLYQEVHLSKKRIEQELGAKVNHFCYPYGREEDFNQASVDMVKALEFKTSVTAIHGLNHASSDPFRLKRLSVDAMLPPFYFQERLAGLHKG